MNYIIGGHIPLTNDSVNRFSSEISLLEDVSFSQGVKFILLDAPLGSTCIGA